MSQGLPVSDQKTSAKGSRHGVPFLFPLIPVCEEPVIKASASCGQFTPTMTDLDNHPQQYWATGDNLPTGLLIELFKNRGCFLRILQDRSSGISAVAPDPEVVQQKQAIANQNDMPLRDEITSGNS